MHRAAGVPQMEAVTLEIASAFTFHDCLLAFLVFLCCSLQNGMDLLDRAIVRGALVQTSPR